MAIASMKNGADKIRINPGNIGKKWVTEVIETAKNTNARFVLSKCRSLEKDLWASGRRACRSRRICREMGGVFRTAQFP